MPQLDQIMVSYASQIVPLLIVLALIYFGIARAILPKVQGTIEARANRVAGDLAAADAAHEEADRIEETYRQRINDVRAESGRLTSEAKINAAQENAERLAAADEKLDAKLAEAETLLAEKREAALAEVEGVAIEAAREIVATIAGGSVSEAEAQNAVKEAMAHG